MPSSNPPPDRFQREIDWKSLRWLMLGYVIGLPAGTYALINAPADPAQILLGLFVIATATMMLRGFRLILTYLRSHRVITCGAGKALDDVRVESSPHHQRNIDACTGLERAAFATRFDSRF